MSKFKVGDIVRLVMLPAEIHDSKRAIYESYMGQVMEVREVIEDEHDGEKFMPNGIDWEGYYFKSSAANLIYRPNDYNYADGLFDMYEAFQHLVLPTNEGGYSARDIGDVFHMYPYEKPNKPCLTILLQNYNAFQFIDKMEQVVQMRQEKDSAILKQLEPLVSRYGTKRLHNILDSITDMTAGKR